MSQWQGLSPRVSTVRGTAFPALRARRAVLKARIEDVLGLNHRLPLLSPGLGFCFGNVAAGRCRPTDVACFPFLVPPWAGDPSGPGGAVAVPWRPWAGLVAGPRAGAGRRHRAPAERPAPAELPVAHDLRPGLLCGGDDAHGRAALRHGPLRRGLPRQPTPVRRDDCGRHAHQQDGPRAPQGRPGPEARRLRPGLEPRPDPAVSSRCTTRCPSRATSCPWGGECPPPPRPCLSPLPLPRPLPRGPSCAARGRPFWPWPWPCGTAVNGAARWAICAPLALLPAALPGPFPAPPAAPSSSHCSGRSS